MASSPETDYERKSKEAPVEQKDNPFIKFRRFADAQVGSILQGLIGLPSTLSRTGGNPRWADFDEDLRRRDELQSKQRKLKDAGEWQPRDGVTDTPNTNMKRQQNESIETREEKSSAYFPSNETLGRDILLYSPVSKALFAHLGGPGSKTWSMSSNATEAVRSMYLPFEVLETQHPKTTIEAVQCMAYNELDKRPFLRSEYSLLPYLLFSPYSPIRLEQKMDHEEAKTAAISRVDSFPYSIAFEDLIQTTHGAFQKPFRYYHPFERLNRGINRNASPSVNWMGWIHNLYGTSFLQQREVQQLSIAQLSMKGYQTSPFARMSRELVNDIKEFHHVQVPDTTQTPETEQDMYDQLATWFSSPSAMIGSLASLLQNPERWVDEKMKLLESEKGHKVVKKIMDENLPREFLEMAAQMDKEMLHHRVPAELQDIFEYINGTSGVARDPEQKERQLEDLKPIMRFLVGPESTSQQPTSASESSLWIPEASAEAPSPANIQSSSQSVDTSEARVVSTSTTTEQTTHEDGSTETCVTVWKRYSDGRESTTITNHFSNHACDENGNPVGKDIQDTKPAAQQKVQQEKKGWFWN